MRVMRPTNLRPSEFSVLVEAFRNSLPIPINQKRTAKVKRQKDGSIYVRTGDYVIVLRNVEILNDDEYREEIGLALEDRARRRADKLRRRLKYSTETKEAT